VKHFGVCNLSQIAQRKEPQDASEMVNQVLFGEYYEILQHQKKWLKIRLLHDDYEGWIDGTQSTAVSEEEAAVAASSSLTTLSGDFIEMVSRHEGQEHFPIFLGSCLPQYHDATCTLHGVPYQFSGQVAPGVCNRDELVAWAKLYLHTPYLWGGRSPLGIDCSGYTQMVYRLAGIAIPRDAYQQAEVGETLSFIEEAEKGDLAFFDNEEGRIIHVGIILDNHYILHASGCVRCDRLDQYGIYNASLKTHTHHLRLIKKIR